MVVWLLLAGCGPQKPPAVAEAERHLPERVDFNRHIKPILSDRCFACHGPDANAREAGLRLDVAEQAFAELPEHPGARAIVPGNLRRSEVFRRIVSDDPEQRMPPPASNLSLSAEEIALLARWIEQGAEYKPHWAFIPPERPAPPPVDDEAWVRNDIDRFVRATLSERGGRPSPEADRETLIRRVTFALTGLPPTIEEIDAFLADDRPDAYERVVDRLLASEAYGEHMAAEWLDVARYADSHGYQDDGLRTMWPWRDWVIDAFNRNLPYDAFVTWQLAGDLLPEPTQEQILATGFNRNHMQSQEGGIVPEEYRVEYVADRVQTLGTAFLGLTMQCARCHDHKYDPVSQKEYFELFAFFNQVNEFGNIPYAGEASPTVTLVDAETEARLTPLRSRIRALEAETAIDHADYDDGYARWLADLEQGRRPTAIRPKGLVGHYPLDGFTPGKDDRLDLANTVRPAASGYYWGDMDKVPEVVEGRFGRAMRLRGEGWLDMGPDRYYFERNEPFSLSLWVHRLDSLAGPLMTKTGGLMNGKRGYVCEILEDGTLSASLNHVFPDNSIEIRTLDPLPVGRWVHLVMTYDGSSRAEGLTLYLDGQPIRTKVVVDNLQKSIRHSVDYLTGTERNWGEEGNLRIGFVGPNLPRLDATLVDEFRVFDRRLTALEVAVLSGVEDPLGDLLAASARTPAQERALRAYYVAAVDPVWPVRFRALTRLRGEENAILTPVPEVMVMRDRREPRPTFVLARGAYDAPRERVEAGTPEAILAFPEDLPPNRLGLARWLFDPAHPLTARVAVNRYWQMHFGRGLVATPEDFGNQGALPTHPELLDWLAVWFRDNGWDLKALHRLILTSATYRQASVADAAMRQADPNNEWLARGPARRLTAEQMRDHVLAASGLLVRTIGGPPVKPYQPPGLWKELATRNATEYVPDTGDKLYRRSLYTIWKRTSPPPSMISFDAAERNFCTVRRQSTNTPLQALVLLNDPQVVEAARMLAERAVREGGTTPEARITYAFRLLTSRYPDAAERATLTALYAAEQETFAADEAAALALLGVGEHPRDESLDPVTVAAYTVVANTIMNVDASVMVR